MSVDDSPQLPITVGVLVTGAMLLLFATVVSNPFAIAAGIAASLVTGTLAGLSVARHHDSGRNPLENATVSSPSAAADYPPLAPEPDGLDPELMFADLILHERAEADERDQPPRVAARNR